MTLERDREIRPLTGLRALAAWWIVAFHFARGEVSAPILREVIGAGHVAVDLFFVLSGFVLARRYGTEELAAPGGRRAFWMRRFARLYPLYVVSLALGVYSESPRSVEALATSAGVARLAAQLAALNSLSHRWMFRHNWAAWSLSVEALFYLLFPWILPWVVRRKPLRVISWCVLAALVAPALYTVLDPDHLGRPLVRGDEVLWSWYLKFFPLQRLPMFVAGVAAARIGEQAALPRGAGVMAVVVLLAVVTLGVVPYAFLQGGALLPLFVVIVIALASPPRSASLVTRVLGGAPLVLLGRASYATYILHVPLFVTLARFDPDLWERLSHVMLYMVLLLALSLLAHRFIEEPAQRALLWRGSKGRAWRSPEPSAAVS